MRKRTHWYRHIDFTPEDADKRRIDFNQTRTIHFVFVKYRLNMNGAEVGRRQGSSSSSRTMTQETLRPVQLIANSALRPIQQRTVSVRSSISATIHDRSVLLETELRMSAKSTAMSTFYTISILWFSFNFVNLINQANAERERERFYDFNKIQRNI